MPRLLAVQWCNWKPQQLMEELWHKAPNVTFCASMDRHVALQQITEEHHHYSMMWCQGLDSHVSESHAIGCLLLDIMERQTVDFEVTV